MKSLQYVTTYQLYHSFVKDDFSVAVISDLHFSYKVVDSKLFSIYQMLDKNKQRLEKVNESTKKTLEKSKQFKEIVNNLKPTKLTKNNYLISDVDINTINEYIENVDSNVSQIKSVNDLTNIMEDFEDALNNHYNQIDELENTIDEKDEKIQELESSIKDKDNTIQKKQKRLKD